MGNASKACTPKPHRKIAGHIKPERHILLLPGRGIGLCKLIQKSPGFDKTEEIGFEHLAGRLHVVELPIAKGLQNERLVLFEDDQVHPG